MQPMRRVRVPGGTVLSILRFTVWTIGLIAATVVSRLTWAYGEALYPSRGLPIDNRDVDEELRELGESQPSGANVTHRRCAATFRIQFAAGS
jgi:hypothetical protein